MISFMHRKCTGRVISLKTPSMYVKFLAAIRLRSTAQVFLAFLAFALYNASQRLEFEKVFLGNWTAMCFTRLEVLHQSSIHLLFDLFSPQWRAFWHVRFFVEIRFSSNPRSFLRLLFFGLPVMFKIYDKLGKMHNTPSLFIALDRINFTPLSFGRERYNQQFKTS